MIAGHSGDMPSALAACLIPSIEEPPGGSKDIGDTLVKRAIVVEILGQRIVDDARTD